MLVTSTPEFVQWVERADRYAAPDTIDRAWADAFLGTMNCVSGRYAEGVNLLRRALELSRQLRDNNAYWMAAFLYSMYAGAPQRLQERVHLAEELAAVPRTNINMTTLGTALFHMGSTFLESGQRQRGEEFFREMRDLSERSAQPILKLLAMRAEVFLATLDGRLEEAVETNRRMRQSGNDMGLPESASVAAAYFSLTPLLHTGRYEEALKLAQSLPSPQGSAASAICLACLGRNAEVTKLLEGFIGQHFVTDSVEDETPVYVLAMLLEAAVIVKHTQAADLLLHRLADSNTNATSYFCMTCIQRHLGEASTLLGRPAEARAHYRDAVKVAIEMGFRPELALTRVSLAELLLKNYPEEKREALDHLNFAIAEFRDMKMQASLERALRNKEILKA
jgi:tetratricopeptide (TPR) repeat protein